MITMKRTYKKRWTESVLTMPDGKEYATLERPWVDNKPYISCIPEGIYRVYRDHHGKHKWYRLDDEQVEPRTAIEIHPATLVEHLQGCIAPCIEVKNGVAMESGYVCQVLVDWFGEHDWILEITS